MPLNYKRIAIATFLQSHLQFPSFFGTLPDSSKTRLEGYLPWTFRPILKVPGNSFKSKDLEEATQECLKWVNQHKLFDLGYFSKHMDQMIRETSNLKKSKRDRIVNELMAKKNNMLKSDWSLKNTYKDTLDATFRPYFDDPTKLKDIVAAAEETLNTLSKKRHFTIETSVYFSFLTSVKLTQNVSTYCHDSGASGLQSLETFMDRFTEPIEIRIVPIISQSMLFVFEYDDWAEECNDLDMLRSVSHGLNAIFKSDPQKKMDDTESIFEEMLANYAHLKKSPTSTFGHHEASIRSFIQAGIDISHSYRDEFQTLLGSFSDKDYMGYSDFVQEMAFFFDGVIKEVQDTLIIHSGRRGMNMQSFYENRMYTSGVKLFNIVSILGFGSPVKRSIYNSPSSSTIQRYFNLILSRNNGLFSASKERNSENWYHNDLSVLKREYKSGSYNESRDKLVIALGQDIRQSISEIDQYVGPRSLFDSQEELLDRLKWLACLHQWGVGGTLAQAITKRYESSDQRYVTDPDSLIGSSDFNDYMAEHPLVSFDHKAINNNQKEAFRVYLIDHRIVQKNSRLDPKWYCGILNETLPEFPSSLLPNRDELYTYLKSLVPDHYSLTRYLRQITQPSQSLDTIKDISSEFMDIYLLFKKKELDFNRVKDPKFLVFNVADDFKRMGLPIDLLNGKVITDCNNFSISYEGGWNSNGRFHGIGRLSVKSMSYSFKGSWKNGNKSQGVLKHGDLIYEGSWLKDAYSGDGFLKYDDGIISVEYDGEFLKGKKHGYAKNYSFERYDDFNSWIYQGAMENDRKHGKGTLTHYANNDNFKWCGYFKENQRHGYGQYAPFDFEKESFGSLSNVYFYNDRLFKYTNDAPNVPFENENMDWLPSGEGSLYHIGAMFIDYQGTFVDGLREGSGISYSLPGVKFKESVQLYNGGWKNDKRDGIGTSRNTDNSIEYENQKWRNGHLRLNLFCDSDDENAQFID